MSRIGKEWIGLVEATYHLDGSDSAWLYGWLDCAAAARILGFRFPAIANRTCIPVRNDKLSLIRATAVREPESVVCIQ